MVVAFLCMSGKRFNEKCIKPFLHCTEAINWSARIPKRGCHDNSGKFCEEMGLQRDWQFHELLQSMWW